MLWSHFLKQGT